MKLNKRVFLLTRDSSIFSRLAAAVTLTFMTERNLSSRASADACYRVTAPAAYVKVCVCVCVCVWGGGVSVAEYVPIIMHYGTHSQRGAEVDAVKTQLVFHFFSGVKYPAVGSCVTQPHATGDGPPSAMFAVLRFLLGPRSESLPRERTPPANKQELFVLSPPVTLSHTNHRQVRGLTQKQIGQCLHMVYLGQRDPVSLCATPQGSQSARNFQ